MLAPAPRPVQNQDGPKGDEDAKVIVRSNGTVTYVGKDIAYHLWKFGLLGNDFGYKRFFTYPDHECWISAESGEPNIPASAAQPPSITSSIRASPIRSPTSSRLCAAWDTPSRPTTTRTSATRWSRSRRAAPSSWATKFPKKTSKNPTSKSAAARASALKPTTLSTSSSPPRAPKWTRVRPGTGDECSRAPEDRRANRHRRLALLHAQGHA